MSCPHCADTRRYTDPLLQVRCTTCLNVLNDEAPGTPMGAVQDLDAPMTISGRTYPGAFTHYDHA